MFLSVVIAFLVLVVALVVILVWVWRLQKDLDKARRANDILLEEPQNQGHIVCKGCRLTVARYNRLGYCANCVTEKR